MNKTALILLMFEALGKLKRRTVWEPWR